MTRNPITVELIQSDSDPHWASPALQREFKQFFLTLTQGDVYHRGVDPRALRIDKQNITLMGEFYIAICDLWNVQLGAAIAEWLAKRAGRKIRIEFQEFEVTGMSLSELSSVLVKFTKIFNLNYSWRGWHEES